ncbi:MAG: ABC transporter substrate-binding protein [Deltaproteobacteria bacterium]|nr:ABC transporter substrate-binding protein [Deltaproteobacteria bacterium]
MKKCLFFTIITTLLITGSVDAQQNAKDFLKRKHEAVVSILRRSTRAANQTGERNIQLFNTLDELLDYDAVSREALRDHWSELNATKQGEFVALLKQLVESNYRRNLESTLEYDIRYIDESDRTTGTVVRTVARSKKNRRAPEIHIDYTLKKTNKDWRVVDVVTDGVSLVSNYRNQFNRIINRDGWDELLKRMRKRIESGIE